MASLVHDQADINTVKMNDGQLMITKKVAFNYVIHQLTYNISEQTEQSILILHFFDISKIRL